jgi:hypothetical protein
MPARTPGWTGVDRHTAAGEKSERHFLLLLGGPFTGSRFLPALVDLRRYMALIDFTDALHCVIGQWCQARSRDV